MRRKRTGSIQGPERTSYLSVVCSADIVSSRKKDCGTKRDVIWSEKYLSPSTPSFFGIQESLKHSSNSSVVVLEQAAHVHLI